MSTWKNDPAHSRLGFVARHLGITDIYGRFADAALTVEAAREDLTDAVFTLTAQTAGIDTRVPPRDEHLRSADFFAVGQFPELRFTSSVVHLGPDRTGTVTGALSLHGVTREMTFDLCVSNQVTNPMNQKPTISFKVSGAFKRSDFGIGPSIPAAIVGDVVRVTADMECAPA
ncbi:YceI family protein [Desulfovibrio legallii]|jgi:polyisoprenoid-binding protein YceI|uniref:Polyisoprenoid-binding protein YceI n=1 Tax=Desulfovibrio legallii TaxID=571438 RepID=A0A1G7R2D4_9BACT|nr:YceI family protein [Desulfovibrio legallii]SDG04110.1 Polyisoprenoid-binding protein YceI [Desulfovibrio legallii]